MGVTAYITTTTGMMQLVPTEAPPAVVWPQLERVLKREESVLVKNKIPLPEN